MGFTQNLIDAAYRMIRPGLDRAAERDRRQDMGDMSGLETQSIEQLVEIARKSFPGNYGVSQSQQLSDSEAKNSLQSWQYAGATLVADAVMSAEYHVQDRGQGAGSEWETNDEHGFAQFLRRGNDLMPGKIVWYYTILELAATGKSYWKLLYDGMELPAGYVPMPGIVSPKLDPDAESTDSMITGWTEKVRYSGEWKTNHYEPGEVVFLQLPTLESLFGGKGPIQAAGGSINLANKIADAQWAAFKQGIWPGVLFYLATAHYNNKQKREEFLTEANDRFQGAKRTGKAMALPDDVEAEFPGRSPKDMMFPESAQQTKEEVLGILRVPDALLGRSENVNKAVAQALQEIFARWTIKPKLTLLEAQINQQVADRYWGAEDGRRMVRLSFADPAPVDEEDARRRDQMELRENVVTRGEYRERRGHEPADWGETMKVKSGTVFVEPNSDGAPQAPAGSQQSYREQQVGAPEGLNKFERAMRIAEAETVKAQQTARMASAVTTWFDNTERRVLEAWENHKRGQSLDTQQPDDARYVDRALTQEALQSQIKEQVDPHLRAGIALGGNFEASFAPAQIASQWSETHASIDKAAAQFSKQHWSTVAQTTRRRVYNETVLAAIKEHKTWNEIREDIVDTFGTMKESRVASIATTETTRLFNAGQDAFREQTDSTHKQWITSFVNSRASHKRADGQQVRKEELFDVGGERLAYPGAGSKAENNINCNCTTATLFPQDLGES